MGSFTWTDMMTLILQIFQGIVINFFLYHLLTPRYSLARCMGISMLITTAVTCIGYLDFSNMTLRKILQISNFYIITRSLYKDSRKRDCFAIALMLTLALTNDWLASLAVGVLFPEAEEYPSGIRLLTGNLIYSVTFTTSIYIFLVFWKKVRGKVLPRSIYATLLIPLSHVLLTAFNSYDTVVRFSAGKGQIRPVIFAVLGGAVSMIADIALFQVIADNSQKERLAARLEMMERQTQAEYEYYNAISESREEIRRIRHDFNNQLQTAYSMVRDKEGGREAAQFLKELEQHIEEAAPAPRCANWIVNAVLQEKAKEAKERGVSLEGEVELSENCGIEKVDLCSVFSNLLDNAIRSAASCEKEKWVKVKSYQKGGYCVARVENASQAGEKRRDGRKGKEKNEGKESGHGYGLLILQSIAEKYHGEFQTEKADGMFAAEIKLKMVM